MHNIMMYIPDIPFYLKLIKSLGGFFFVFPIKEFATNQLFPLEVKKKGNSPLS